MSDIRNRRCHCGRLLRARHNDEIRKSEAKRDGYSAEKSELRRRGLWVPIRMKLRARGVRQGKANTFPISKAGDDRLVSSANAGCNALVLCTQQRGGKYVTSASASHPSSLIKHPLSICVTNK